MKVRRVIWKECGAYIYIVSKTIIAVCDGKFFPCVFKDSEDILATDWERPSENLIREANN